MTVGVSKSSIRQQTRIQYPITPVENLLVSHFHIFRIQNDFSIMIPNDKSNTTNSKTEVFDFLY